MGTFYLGRVYTFYRHVVSMMKYLPQQGKVYQNNLYLMVLTIFSDCIIVDSCIKQGLINSINDFSTFKKKKVFFIFLILSLSYFFGPDLFSELT